MLSPQAAPNKGGGQGCPFARKSPVLGRALWWIITGYPAPAVASLRGCCNASGASAVDHKYDYKRGAGWLGLLLLALDLDVDVADSNHRIRIADDRPLINLVSPRRSIFKTMRTTPLGAMVRPARLAAGCPYITPYALRCTMVHTIHHQPLPLLLDVRSGHVVPYGRP